MKVAFRVDAAIEIGNGHGFRCLALANALTSDGATCHFIARRLTPDVEARIRDAGHRIHLLEASPDPSGLVHRLAHSAWLDITPQTDGKATLGALNAIGGVDAVVLDHYALDREWELEVRPSRARILVIDDLADRPHDCDALVDSNFFSNFEHRYDALIPSTTKRYLGPRYAMLRPEFATLRATTPPCSTQTDRLVVSLGGIDRTNVTGVVLEALERLDPFDAVDIVIGSAHPTGAEIARITEKRGYTLHVDTPRFGDLLAQATLAVGAAGTTTWERMCLGVPTLALAIATNQEILLQDTAAAGLLMAYGGALDDAEQISGQLERLRRDLSLRRQFTKRGQELVDGKGLHRMVEILCGIAET